VTATVEPSTGRAKLVPGSSWFILVLAMTMAATALGVDSVLPAFPDIRESLGLADDATEVTQLITYYLLGNSIGLLPAGILADRYGRRAVMWGGLALYIVGAVGALLAPSLGLMFLARFVWGLGSAGPRVAAMAMVRDAYAGEQMAKQMSFIMAVFILVPAFAPLLASGILLVAPWQAVFGFTAVMAAVLSLAVARLPETLAVDDRRDLSGSEVWAGVRAVLATPGTIAYLVSLTAMFGVFLSYLASSEVVLDQVFDLGGWFPVYFGGLALVMGAAMTLNGRVVERVGLDRLIRIVFTANVVASSAMAVLALATSGTPPFWLFVLAQAAVLFGHQMLIPNLNAAAMRPLAHVAGTGAAILGMVPGVLAAIIGGLIDARFDGTVTPLSLAFVASTIVAFAAWAATARGSRTSDPAARPAAPAAHRRAR
jgi:DHA1 family bicyclomycin/chloramphenicol resistance-like MFS transporter